MNKQSYFTIGALVIAILVIGVIGFTVRKPVVNVETNRCEFGAVSGPNVDFPSFTVNGVLTYYNTTGLNKATTTTNDAGNSVARVVCSIKTPTATTTLMSASVSFTTSTTSATIVDIAEAANSYATTTVLGATYILAANAKGVILASTTSAVSGGAPGLISPNQYINVKMAGGRGTYSPVGTCQAVFQGI